MEIALEASEGNKRWMVIVQWAPCRTNKTLQWVPGSLGGIWAVEGLTGIWRRDLRPSCANAGRHYKARNHRELSLGNLGTFWGEEESGERAKCCRAQVAPAFQKFSLLHFTFTKDLHWYLFSPTERSEDFRFYEKKKRCKSIALGHCFAGTPCRGSLHAPQQEWRCQAPSLGTTQHLSIKSPELWTVSLSICAWSQFILCNP